MADLSFTSKEVVAIINGGCLCTIGRGTCEYHALTEPPASELIDGPAYAREDAAAS